MTSPCCISFLEGGNVFSIHLAVLAKWLPKMQELTSLLTASLKQGPQSSATDQHLHHLSLETALLPNCTGPDEESRLMLTKRLTDADISLSALI